MRVSIRYRVLNGENLTIGDDLVMWQTTFNKERI